MTNTVETKLQIACVKAKVTFDKEHFNICKVARAILDLQKEFKTDFVFVCNNKGYISAKGNTLRIGSVTMAYDINYEMLVDSFDQVADDYFKEMCKKENLEHLKYYPAENEDIINKKEKSWLEDFAF